MNKLIGYTAFVTKNSPMSESEFSNIENSMNINEQVDVKKTLMEFVHSNMYNKLTKRILGSNNKNLETVIREGLPSTKVVASDIFKPIWSQIEKFTNPNTNDVKALILKDMQNEFQTDKTALDTLSISKIPFEASMQSVIDDLKDGKTVMKLIFEGKLVNVFKQIGLYDKMTVQQQDVINKIINKKYFMTTYRDKMRDSLDNDFTLGLSNSVLNGYAMSPGFKEDKSRNSSMEADKIGFYLTSDIVAAGIGYYIAGLSSVISKKFNETIETADKISQQSRISTRKPDVSRTETSRSEFKQENLANFGF